MTPVCPHGLLSARLCESLERIQIRPGIRWSATVGESTISRDSLEALRGPLSQAVYEVLHAGRRGGPVRSKSLREARLTQQLAAATPHRTTYARARVVEAASACNTMVVELCDVRVSVPAETIRSDDGAVQPGDWVTVELPTARPALCPGFFLTDGFLGRPVHPPLLRIYVHLTEPGSAPAVWHQALSMLEEKRVRYRAKILSLPGPTRAPTPWCSASAPTPGTSCRICRACSKTFLARDRTRQSSPAHWRPESRWPGNQPMTNQAAGT
ncbi:hypothetical protein KJK32_44965 [Streptomyces sp. JCM17656]|nr:hypothetical protein KJK32_44965 [Streptomyces sp. JCM17656]